MISWPNVSSLNNSWLMRLPGLVKLGLVFVLSLLLFLLPSWEYLAALMCLLCVMVSSLRCSLRTLFWPLIFVAPFLLTLFLVHLATAFGDVSTLTKVPKGLFSLQSHIFAADATVSISGVSLLLRPCEEALYYALRIVALVLLSQCFVLSTNFDELFISLEQHACTLDRFGINLRPVFAALSLSIRFMPVFFVEIEYIRHAQLARGAKFEASGIGHIFKAYQALFVPLIIRLFLRADNLAKALDARCFMSKLLKDDPQ